MKNQVSTRKSKSLY